MKFIGNLLWFIVPGLIGGIVWFLVGILWCISLIGIPVGLQCFKFAGLSFFPFGKEIFYSDSAGNLLLNILWLIFGGIEIACLYASIGILFFITIIGIPFGFQCFKIVRLSIMPFGAEIRKI